MNSRKKINDEKILYPAIVSSRLTEHQKSRLNKLAWKNHCTKSEYLRKIIIADLNRK